MTVFGIAAYLLNPLKSTYTYEELAKDYLDGEASSGKRGASGKNIPEKGLGGGYARTGTSGMLYGLYRFCHQSPLKVKLQETGMWKVYTEIELPLVFTLRFHGKMGNRSKREELKNMVKS